MPTYSNSPPPDGRGTALQLRRTPTRKPLTAYVTSEDLTGCPTHFYKGRTMPCEEGECEACENGIGWRWHGYLSAWEPATGIHFLFEMTARVTEEFVAYRDQHGTTRGAVFKAQRIGSLPNSRVGIQIKRGDSPTLTLPKAPNLVACLAIIWNLATPTLSVVDALKSVPRVRVDARGNGTVKQILEP